MKSLVAATLLLFLTGCGMRTEMVRVNVPDARVNTEEGPVVVVRPVQDARKDILEAVPTADRSRNVGGFARGGNGTLVNLESGTVADRTREILIQALRNMGYRTAASCEASCTYVDASITKFSVTMPFEFWRAAGWSQRMLAEISIDVNSRNDGQTKRFTAEGHGSNVYQVVSRENWEIALERAVADLTANFKQSMSGQGQSEDIPDHQQSAH